MWYPYLALIYKKRGLEHFESFIEKVASQVHVMSNVNRSYSIYRLPRRDQWHLHTNTLPTGFSRGEAVPYTHWPHTKDMLMSSGVKDTEWNFCMSVVQQRAAMNLNSILPLIIRFGEWVKVRTNDIKIQNSKLSLIKMAFLPIIASGFKNTPFYLRQWECRKLPRKVRYPLYLFFFR